MAIQALKDRSGFQIRINYNQQRLVIYLGKATKKQAIQFERNLQRLFIGKAAGVTMEPDLALWLAGLSDHLHDKIAQKGLVAPRDPMLHEITRGDAKAFEGYLVNRRTPCLAKATVRKKCSRVKQVFKWGILNKYIEENPLDEVRTASVANKTTYVEVPSVKIHGILRKIECPDARMVLALCRFGGFRYNETAVNTWEECVDLEGGQLTIKSNKTPPIRSCPIFADLRPYLEAVAEKDRCGPLQSRWAAEQTSRTAIVKLIKEAGYEPWPKILHNLRKNRATELLAQFPPQSVAAWLGHDVSVLLEYYAIIKSEDFAGARNFRA